ncbi:Aminopeptidase N, partial [Pseudolycoriella hygida]
MNNLTSCRRKMLRFLFVLVTLFVTSAFAQVFDTYRLPNNTRPETYDVSIRSWIAEGNSSFTGSVRIGIIAVESTDFIRLHHAVQSIESVRVLSADENPITIGNFSYNAAFHFLTIPITGNNLTQGTRYFLDIDFVGFMNSFSGFYRSSYFLNDELKFFGSTQFEPTYARSAFPCYDEPPLKANFTVRITHASNYSAISNMPVVSVTENPDGSETTLFETTPLMSTYLVAFHVSDFPHITSTPPRSIPQRVFASSVSINSSNMALEAGELLLEAISDYVGVPYTLPKMDQIAVPNFPSGAMENWGMVTYAEFYALYNESEDFFTRRLYGMQTISHELAHQWFGNLVTPSWWTFLWLKEGFATFFDYYGVDLVHPEWQLLDFFVVDNNQWALRIDASEFTLPMTHYVEHPIDIDFHFNSIAYNKAGAVIRMFFHVFGEDVFMDALNTYLTNNAYSDADEEDLFDAIALHAWLDPEVVLPPDTNVSTVMGSWTRQAGYPLITVTRNYDDRTNQVTLSQTRYLDYNPGAGSNTTWWVPYNLATPDNPGFENTRAEGWIPNTPSSEITVNNLDADDYLLLNKQAGGFYRIMYDARNYRLISDAIVRNSSQFHPTNVAQLIDDAHEFFETNRINITTVLDLLRVLEFHSDFVSWNPAFDFIFFVNRNFLGHRNYPLWADFVRSLVEEIYDTVGIEDVEDEPTLRKSARENVVHLACMMGSVHCRSDTTRRLRRNIETGEDFHRNLRTVLRCASMRSATRTDFHTMWGILQTLPFDDFQRRYEIIDMMGCPVSRPLLNEYVRSAYNLTLYNEFEQFSVINSVLQNGGNVGVDVVLDFFIENWQQTIDVFGSWFVQNLANYVSNEEHVERFIIFQDILLDAGLMEDFEADFNLYLIQTSVNWLQGNEALSKRNSVKTLHQIKMLQFLLTFVAVFITPTIAQNFTTYRLANNTRPETYDLSITTWVHDGITTFIGSVRIGIIAVESTNFIQLHHNVELLQRVNVVTVDEVRIPIGAYSYNRTFTFLTIPLTGSNLTQGGRYFVDIDFVGTMNSYNGFYRSSYIANGRQVWLGSTQFEATHARNAFPCYDEPSLKSNFTIRITHDPSYSALSNMPAASEVLNPDGSVTTQFETTPLMSTYLVAFHVSNFINVTGSSGKIPQRLFARSTAINATAFPLEAGELLIDAITGYLGIEYSLPKLDHVAVPRWYTYLWMKEGFATFFEYFGVDLVHPDWQMMDYFVVDIAQLMFFADSFQNA